MMALVDSEVAWCLPLLGLDLHLLCMDIELFAFVSHVLKLQWVTKCIIIEPASDKKISRLDMMHLANDGGNISKMEM